MRKRIVTSSALVMSIGVAGILSGCGGKSIDVSQFIEYDLKGVNGKGELNASLKNMDLELEIANKKGIKDIESMNSLADVIDVENFISTIEVKTEEDSKNYSNGDEATIYVTYDENKAKALGINLTNTTIKYKISDLREGTVIDPFSDDVFNVTSGNGIYISSEGGYQNLTLILSKNIPSTDPLAQVKYTMYKATDKSDSNSPGQTGVFADQLSGVGEEDDITVTATVDDSFYESGYALSQDSKTFKGKELIGELVTSLSQIDDDGWESIGKYVQELKTKYIDNASDLGLFSDGFTFKTGGNDDLYQFSDATVTDFKLDQAVLYKTIVNIGNDYSNELDILFSINAKAKSLLSDSTKDMGTLYGSFRVNDLKVKNGNVVFNRAKENDFKSNRGLYGSKEDLLSSIKSEKYDEGEIKFDLK